MDPFRPVLPLNFQLAHGQEMCTFSVAGRQSLVASWRQRDVPPVDSTVINYPMTKASSLHLCDGSNAPTPDDTRQAPSGSEPGLELYCCYLSQFRSVRNQGLQTKRAQQKHVTLVALIFWIYGACDAGFIAIAVHMISRLTQAK